MEAFVLIGLFWIGVSVVWGLVARRKGRSFLAIFALSIFVTPIIGMIVALLLQPTDAAKMSVVVGGESGTFGPVPCPFCKEEIRADAIVCKHCGKDVEPSVDRILEERENQRGAVLEATQLAESRRAEAEIKRKNTWHARAIALKTGIKDKRLLVPAISLGVIIILGVAGFVVSQMMATSLANAKQEKLDKDVSDASKALGDWTRTVYACGAPPADIFMSVDEVSNSAVSLTLSDPNVRIVGVEDFANVTTQLARLEMSVEDAQFVDCIGGILGTIVANGVDGTVRVVPAARPLSEIYDPWPIGSPVPNQLNKVIFQTWAELKAGSSHSDGPVKLSITKSGDFPAVFRR